MIIKNNVSVTFVKNDGRRVVIEGDIVDGGLYRAGAPVRCDCNYNSPQAYIYDGVENYFYCPVCKNKSCRVIFNGDSEETVHLNYIGIDYNSMQGLYKLSETLPYKKWLTISEYFVKLKPSDVKLDYPLHYIGWVTSVPTIVEDILDVPFEFRISNRDVETELLESVKNDVKEVSDMEEYFDYVDKLHEVFSVVETPYGEFNLKGEKIDNPLFPPNDYGRGEYWVVSDDEIWFVRCNYRDGDNLKFNNIFIDGVLNGIGKMIDFDENVYELLKKLK